MITISSYRLQRPVQVGRIGNGLAELVWVTAPLALAAAMVALVVDGVHACARSTVNSGALILLRWRSTSARQLRRTAWASTVVAVHPNRTPSRCPAPLVGGTWQGVSGESALF
jgi:hypothetical protein